MKCFYRFIVIELELPLVEVEIAGLEPWAHQSIVILVSWRYLRHWLTDSDERHRVESILIDRPGTRSAQTGTGRNIVRNCGTT
jgi:hypothetical protein